jgi:hypothetical protein
LTTSQNQRDTQFYEALKRFAGSNATQRVSAANELTQMATRRKWFVHGHPYLGTTLNVFSEAIHLEEEHVVYLAVVDGLDRCLRISRRDVTEALRSADASINDEVLDWMVDCVAILRLWLAQSGDEDHADHGATGQQPDVNVLRAYKEIISLSAVDVAAAAAKVGGRPYRAPGDRDSSGRHDRYQEEFTQLSAAVGITRARKSEDAVRGYMADAYGALRRLTLRWSFAIEQSQKLTSESSPATISCAPSGQTSARWSL